MDLTLIPVVSPRPADLKREGQTLWVRGEAFDLLGQLPADGDIIAASYLGSLFQGDVENVGGRIKATLAYPVAANSPLLKGGRITVAVDADGPIVLPEVE